QEKTSEATSAVRKQSIQKPFSVIKKDRIFLPSIKEIYLLESQYWDKKKILEHQNVLLENLIRQAFYHVPFRKNEMRYRGLKPEHIQTHEDLKKLPVVNKSIMKDRGKDFIADNADQFVFSRGNTGGSTGRPFNYLISEEQAESIYSTQRRGWSWAGWKGNDRLLTIAGGGLGPQGGKKIEVFGFTEETAISVYKEILSYNAHFYRGLPYLMDLFCSYLEKLELNENIKGKGTFLTSEVLLDSQRQRISKHLGEVFDTYGVNDGGSNAMECEAHNGFHLAHEIFLLEILNEENQRLGFNEEGIVTCTHFYNLVMPWIRYKSDDLAILTDERCPCGRTLPLIKYLKGRVTDYLTTPNAVINGTELCNMINSLPMKAYQFIQNDKRNVLVKIVRENGFSKKDEDFIHSQIKKLDDHVNINFEYVEDIPLTEGAKFKYVINNIGDNKIHPPAQVKKKSKPKICHIGGAHSVHLSNIVEELDKLGYEQCVIGYYPAEQSITPKHIPVYFFPFRNYRMPEWSTLRMEDKLADFLRIVFDKERPDIVHGHSLLYSCVPVYMAKAKFGISTILLPWSPETLKIEDPLVTMYCQRCIDTLDYFMHGLPNIFRDFQARFTNLPDEKYVVFRPLIDLAPYETRRQVTSSPMILSSRVMGEYYRQDLLIKALPSVIREFPDTKVSLIIGQNSDQGRPYFEKMIQLARQLGVEQHCTFIPRSLSQLEFAELIKSHNIIYSIAIHDGGLASTVVQTAYSGGIAILRDTKWVDGILDHGVNALRTRVDEKNIRETLLYAARNVEELQRRFIRNNHGLITQDKRHLLKNLLDCYQRLFARTTNAKAAEFLSMKGIL
ncbi:MAG: glycosyltransferase, partial [Desulfobacteraceae bacterium]|nr:glycosyltransferase [Desulfobacteraceae bacterium]